MTLTDVQWNFFQIIKENYKKDCPKYVLSKITSLCLNNGKVVSNLSSFDELIGTPPFTIYEDGNHLFTGTYEQLIDNLFEFIFDRESFS